MVTQPLEQHLRLTVLRVCLAQSSLEVCTTALERDARVDRLVEKFGSGREMKITSRVDV